MTRKEIVAKALDALKRTERRQRTVPLWLVLLIAAALGLLLALLLPVTSKPPM